MNCWRLTLFLVGAVLLFTARPAQAQRVWVGPPGPPGPVVVAPTWQVGPTWGRPGPSWYRGGWYGSRPGWYRSGWYGSRGGWYGSVRGPRGGRVGFYRR
ncbi:MAG TPA: hypothetical protein VGX70_06205 [Gemmataceae bacterium]|jgi:hypothetical protein|nr:hypothetical protein [Gemmataceae bacterium]